MIDVRWGDLKIDGPQPWREWRAAAAQCAASGGSATLVWATREIREGCLAVALWSPANSASRVAFLI